MSKVNRRLGRLERQAANRPESRGVLSDEWAATTLDRPADEGRELARTTAGEFAEAIRQYREYYKLSAQDAIARSEETGDGLLQRALTAPPDEVSWFDIDIIARNDPAAAQRRWEEVKEAARGELRTGQRAAAALGSDFQTCWSRARFLAVRGELADSLGPRNAAELLLIDQLTAYQIQLWDWQKTLTLYTSLANLGTRRREQSPYEPPRQTFAEAMETAAGMVERFERMFCRALAAFQAQRRQAGVTIRRAGQVNVAQNQINMAG